MRIAAVLLLLIYTAFAEDGEVVDESSEEASVEGVASSPAASLLMTFVDLCEVVAPFCGILCFLAPFPTINQVVRDKTVGGLPLLPYSSMICNACIWTLYGLLKGLPTVWKSNAVGLVLGCYYFARFVQICGPNASNLPGSVNQHVRAVGAMVLLNLGLVTGMESQAAADIIGNLGVAICVIMFASPLAALKHVITTKSAASIPLPFSVMCLINCVAWATFGWFKIRDFKIYFPNWLGVSCSVAQLALKGIYGNKVGKEPPQ